MKIYAHLLLAAVVWALAGRVLAADVPVEFNAANRFYAEGKFADAAAAYENILVSGAISPATYFNYGNAEFKSGHLGLAIAAYHRAVQLAPRDAEVQANLEFARNQVQSPTLHESRWAGWLGTLTLNEWTVLATAAFWLTFASLTAIQIRPALKTTLRGLTIGAAAVTLLSGASLALNAANYSRQIAVVIATEVTARSGPFDEAQSAFTAHDGAELAILDRRDDWLQVTDESRRIGWLPSKQVDILPGS